MSDTLRQYVTSPATKTLVERALLAIKNDFMAAENAPEITSPTLFVDYLRLYLNEHDREHFCVIFLNNQHQIINTEILFSGTLNHVEVHPRIIARKALQYNAAAILLAHNHPSGNTSSGQADKALTKHIAKCLSMLDIRILDHIIVSPGDSYYSFAEHGLL
ncbi:RadC family protein [Klebsiella pneumoniae]|uniref:JAB domain-containing protein n=1 Tax=Klebsiella pneumoniae TaxID=573 RepID=UPI0039822B1A